MFCGAQAATKLAPGIDRLESLDFKAIEHTNAFQTPVVADLRIQIELIVRRVVGIVDARSNRVVGGGLEFREEATSAGKVGAGLRECTLGLPLAYLGAHIQRLLNRLIQVNNDGIGNLSVGYRNRARENEKKRKACLPKDQTLHKRCLQFYTAIKTR